MKISGKRIPGYAKHMIHVSTPPDLCIVCGAIDILADHPLFEGSLCKDCKVHPSLSVCQRSLLYG